MHKTQNGSTDLIHMNRISEENGCCMNKYSLSSIFYVSGGSIPNWSEKNLLIYLQTYLRPFFKLGSSLELLCSKALARIVTEVGAQAWQRDEIVNNVF